jgi:hypothetical protein
LPAKDRSLARLLVDVPALPAELLTELLDGLKAAGGEHATLALITARDIVLMRPANRPEALRSMLEMAVAVDPDIRFAVRLEPALNLNRACDASEVSKKEVPWRIYLKPLLGFQERRL